MKISIEEYDERAARVLAGTESDDDRRLVALYADERVALAADEPPMDAGSRDSGIGVRPAPRKTAKR